MEHDAHSYTPCCCILVQIELIAGLGVQYVRETTGLCKPVEPDYKEPPVDKIRHPAVKCFRPFLDRFLAASSGIYIYDSYYV